MASISSLARPVPPERTGRSDLLARLCAARSTGTPAHAAATRPASPRAALWAAALYLACPTAGAALVEDQADKWPLIGTPESVNAALAISGADKAKAFWQSLETRLGLTVAGLSPIEEEIVAANGGIMDVAALALQVYVKTAQEHGQASEQAQAAKQKLDTVWAKADETGRARALTLLRAMSGLTGAA